MTGKTLTTRVESTEDFLKGAMNKTNDGSRPQ